MEITDLNELGDKKLIVFDLDGTLAESKSVIDHEMVDLLSQLLAKKPVAVIGGGKYGLFQEQLLDQLKIDDKLLGNLFLFPTTATAFYRYENGAWENQYLLELTPEQRQQIKDTFEKVFEEINYQHPEKTYGPVIEDRGTQVTFSALGQEIVAELGKEGIRQKEEWKANHSDIKMKIAELMQKYLPDLEVRAAGTTSVDVTQKGIDKSYGLHQIQDHLNIPIKEMLFVGDAIFPGGNDYAVTNTEADYIKIENPEQTKAIIRQILG